MPREDREEAEHAKIGEWTKGYALGASKLMTNGIFLLKTKEWKTLHCYGY